MCQEKQHKSNIIMHRKCLFTSVILLPVLVAMLVGLLTYSYSKPLKDRATVSTTNTDITATKIAGRPTAFEKLQTHPVMPFETSHGEGQILGLVLFADGSPVGGAEVRIRVSERPGSIIANADSQREPVRSDDGGNFVIVELPFGMYAVVAHHESGTDASGVQISLTQPAAQVRLVLKEGAVVAGVVEDGNGGPIVGAVLSPIEHDGMEEQYYIARTMSVKTDQAGGFVTDILPFSKWRFFVEAEGYAPLLTDEVEAGSEHARFVLVRGAVVAGVVLDAATAEPIAGLTVKARTKSQPYRVVHTISDGGGAFQLAALSTAVYDIGIDDPDRVIVDGQTQIEVEEGQSTPELILKVGSGGEVRGRVYDSTTGEGIVGAELSGWPKTGFPTSRKAPETDESGEYELTGLTPGETFIRINLPAGYPQNTAAQNVFVAAGGELDGVDFAVTRGPVIAGTVVDAIGATVQGAKVSARSLGPSSVRADTTSGNDGSFALTGVVPGVEVFLRAEGADASSELAGPMTVPADGLRDIQLVLGESPDGLIAGTVVYKDGRPARCYVASFPTDEQQRAFLMSYETTDAKGNFLIANLPAGTYELRLGERTNSPLMQTKTTAATVTLAPGEQKRNMHLVFEGDPGFAISGRVIDVSGNPVGGADVSAQGDESILHSTMTGGDGSFKITGLFDSAYTLTAGAGAAGSATLAGIQAGAEGIEIVLGGNPKIEGQIIDASTRAPLTTFEVGTATLGADVNELVSRTEFKMFQDSQGRFVIDAREGTRYVVVRAAGYQPAMTPLGGRLREGETRSGIVIELVQGGASVTGVVLDGAGKKMSGVSIFVGPVATPNMKPLAVTDEEGEFRIDNLAPETTTILARDGERGEGSVNVTPTTDGSPPVRIVLEGFGSIEGNVMFEGQPVVGAAVMVSRQGIPLGQSTRADNGGDFRLDHIPSGEIEVIAVYPAQDGIAMPNLREIVQVISGESVYVDLQFTHELLNAEEPVEQK